MGHYIINISGYAHFINGNHIQMCCTLTWKQVHFMEVAPRNLTENNTLQQWRGAQSSNTNGHVTETGALSPGRSNINIRGDSGRQRDTWTVMLAPCQPGCQDEGDWESTNAHDHTGATICASQCPVNQRRSASAHYSFTSEVTEHPAETLNEGSTWHTKIILMIYYRLDVESLYK